MAACFSFGFKAEDPDFGALFGAGFTGALGMATGNPLRTIALFYLKNRLA
jgi:hypothetical protein